MNKVEGRFNRWKQPGENYDLEAERPVDQVWNKTKFSPVVLALRASTRSIRGSKQDQGGAEIRRPGVEGWYETIQALTQVTIGP